MLRVFPYYVIVHVYGCSLAGGLEEIGGVEIGGPLWAGEVGGDVDEWRAVLGFDGDGPVEFGALDLDKGRRRANHGQARATAEVGGEGGGIGKGLLAGRRGSFEF